MAEIIKKKLINEYDRCAYNVDADGNPILDDPKLSNDGKFIPEIAEDKQNAYIDPQELITKSIDGILTDPENRTLWINGMPYGNAYVDTAEGPFHAEIFNDYETNTIEKDAHYSHIEGRNNSIKGASEGSHVEGGVNADDNLVGNTIDNSKFSHAEGAANTITNSAKFSHIEGIENNIDGALGAHAEGKANQVYSTAIGAHVSGSSNKVFNEYETAIGTGNWSQHYLSENGGDEINTDNKILFTIGNGGETGSSKNAVRVNQDGALYLGPVTKKTDRVVETFNPCNYNGESIYASNVINNDKKELVSKSVQELLTDINHMENITYWKLKNLADTKKLLPGKTYRITDYKPGLSDKYNSTKNGLPLCILSSQTIKKSESTGEYILEENVNNLNRFDIVVKAVSESEISNIATAIAHDYYINENKANYFTGTDFNSWQLFYDFDGNSELYDWVNTSVEQPIIKISPPNKASYNSYIEWFNSSEALGSLYENNVICSAEYYTPGNSPENSYFDLSKNNIKSKTKIYVVLQDNGKYWETNEDWTPKGSDDNNRIIIDLDPNTDILESQGDNKYIYYPYDPAVFSPLEYVFNGSYYYSPAREKQWKDQDSKNPEYTGPKPPTNAIHSYNYKWRVIFDSNSRNRKYEYCLLTNEADFSYMKNNGNAQLTNILLCKDDQKINITEELDNIYSLPKNLPYIIEVKRETDNIGGIGKKTQYSAFIYDGPYTGNYGEIETVTKDKWYILNNYDPAKGVYTVYKDNIGTVSLLINRTDSVGNPVDFTKFADENSSSMLSLYLEDNDGFMTYIQENGVVFIGNTTNQIESNPNVQFGRDDLERKTISLLIQKIDPETNEIVTDDKGNPIEGWDTFELSNYKYTYKGQQYIVWENESGLNNKNVFVISNPDVENKDAVNFTNINNVYIIHCPIRKTAYGDSIVSIRPLEYYVAKSNRSDIILNGDNMTFIQTDFLRSNVLEYQDERNYVQFEPLTGIFDYNNYDIDENTALKYRILAKYDLNLKYEINTDIPLYENFVATYYAETKLIPMTYVNLDISRDYYTDGKYESTGVIYRMIDEYGNDCPYDFKNILFCTSTNPTDTSTINPTNLMLNYTYTFGGIINKDVENPYTDTRNIGDISLLGNCVNNKIYISTADTKYLPRVLFRLAYGYSLINNTFIDCSDTGACFFNYDSMQKGCNTNMSNNIFKNCNYLDIINYSTFSGNYLQNTYGRLYAPEASSTNSIISSTIIDTTFAVDESGEVMMDNGAGIPTGKLNIINSRLTNCNNFIGQFVDSGSNVYTDCEVQSSILYNDVQIVNQNIDDDNVYSAIKTPGIYINEQYHTINADYNSFYLETKNSFNLKSQNSINLSTMTNKNDEGVIVLTPTSDATTPSTPQITKSTYSQTFYYNDSLYKYDDVSKFRDNHTTENSVFFTYTFDKHTLKTELPAEDVTAGSVNSGDYFPSSGTCYTFPNSYYNDANTKNNIGGNATIETKNEKNYLKLGTFYTHNKFNIHTYWGQSNAVEGSGRLQITLTVTYTAAGKKYWGISDNYRGAAFTSYYYHGNYWSEGADTVYTIYTMLDFDKIGSSDLWDKTVSGHTQYPGSQSLKYLQYEKDNGFLISVAGVKLIEKIDFSVHGWSWANSTGNYHCVGDVWLSDLMHYNGSLSTNGNDAGKDPKNVYWNNSKINYYKPSRYKVAANTADSITYIFGKNGIKVGTTLYEFNPQRGLVPSSN